MRPAVVSSRSEGRVRRWLQPGFPYPVARTRRTLVTVARGRSPSGPPSGCIADLALDDPSTEWLQPAGLVAFGRAGPAECELVPVLPLTLRRLDQDSGLQDVVMPGTCSTGWSSEATPAGTVDRG